VPAIIAVAGLGKTYRVPDKQPSLAGTVRDVLRRRTCNVQAMRHVSVQIQPVAMVGYLRASGAGTTTTLKMLCGLPHPSAGRLPVAGHLPQRRQETFRARSP
jgi:ABC-2 type transport system ATP-binding protein